MSPDPKILDEIVRCVNEAVPAQRIVLFGSAARGKMGPYSDLDILVVVPDGNDRIGMAQILYERLGDLSYPKDILVATETDIEDHGENPYLVYHTALTEGRELYHAVS